MKRFWLIGILVIAVATLIGSGVWYWRVTESERLQQKLQALLAAGRYDEAGRLAVKLKLPDPASLGIDVSAAKAELLAAEGWRRISEKDFPGAIQSFEEARTISPDIGPKIADGLSLSYAWIGQEQKALAILDEAILKEPNVTSHYDYRALLYAALGDRARAKADLEQLLALDPNYPRRDAVQNLLKTL